MAYRAADDVFVVQKPPGWNVSVSYDEWDDREVSGGLVPMTPQTDCRQILGTKTGSACPTP